MSTNRNYILDAVQANTKLERMAYEMAEQLVDEKSPIILAGIRDNGVVIAKILAARIKAIAGIESEVIEIGLDKRNPGPIHVSPKMDFNNRMIVVVDDVTNSGKTLLYALKPFLEEHPKAIQTLSLIERTHKAFPVKADYVGLSLATTLQEHIYVTVEGDSVTGAYLE
ncbi:phosphoribosyltransferase [Flavihumibacter rivuli]|uniref:phosphoribosyltransferase family protein n=1 Tax=Flavihumibacter rivuli TaxID=2838156 RepID=UPI001BDE5938|nr:phosphoribosyltransferase family protein [Flavihumibacter rivuli]ULQ57558.1 phosphoribosyltransferase [Flavihumibacter rivuli]